MIEIALAWNRKSGKKCCPISFTNRWNGCFLMISAVLFWYFLISRRATVPGLNLKGTLILRAVGSFLTTFWRRDLAPLNLRVVCLVRAISSCLVSSLVLCLEERLTCARHLCFIPVMARHRARQALRLALFEIQRADWLSRLKAFVRPVDWCLPGVEESRDSTHGVKSCPPGGRFFENNSKSIWDIDLKPRAFSRARHFTPVWRVGWKSN